jgi:hypothetical protein
MVGIKVRGREGINERTGLPSDVGCRVCFSIVDTSFGSYASTRSLRVSCNDDSGPMMPDKYPRI